MTNWLPLDGALAPRSRLSSINTINAPGNTVNNLAVLPPANQASPALWYSAATVHGVVASNGSISRASFLSSFGLGVAGLLSQTRWQYAVTYSAYSDRNMLVAAGMDSYDTLLALYVNTSGVPFYSYLTTAPKALAVGSINNYIVSFNGTTPTNSAPTRVQWCVRGDPSNWTGEGSGFEDLLQMPGNGTAVRGMPDGRMILFGTLQIWYGVTDTFPSQFQFAPLDTAVGCPFPATIAETDKGIIFLGSDLQLRLLPIAGGSSVPIMLGLGKVLRSVSMAATPNRSWGVYDGATRLYYFYIDPTGASPTPFQSLVINTDTGEWGFLDYPERAPRCGTAIPRDLFISGNHEGLIFGFSTGTVFSTSSKLGSENGSNVTATWRSSVIASDLAGNWKQLTKLCTDYRATSKSTVTCKISTDGGNTYEATGAVMSFPVAPNSGRVELDVYRGGAFNTIELTSQSTGFELHRLDVSMTIGGRK